MENDAGHSSVMKVTSEVVQLLGALSQQEQERALYAVTAILGHKSRHSSDDKIIESKQTDVGEDNESLAVFFNRSDKTSASENAKLCAAWHFSKFGNREFSLADIREIATDAGVVLPDRVDMTYRAAQWKSKKLFASMAGETFKPTANAGLFFKEVYGVSPGKMPKSTSSATSGNGGVH